MTDDIVTRLREADPRTPWVDVCNMSLAASEIERLRADMKEAARQYDLLVEKLKRKTR